MQRLLFRGVHFFALGGSKTTITVKSRKKDDSAVRFKPTEPYFCVLWYLFELTPKYARPKWS